MQRTAEQFLNQGQTTAEGCSCLEVSVPTYHHWQHLHGGRKTTEAKRLKELEPESTRLKPNPSGVEQRWLGGC